MDRVKLLLADIGDFNTAFFNSDREQHCPPIHFACKYGNVDIVKWMVEEKGVDVNREYEEELPWTVSYHERTVRKTPLCTACNHGGVHVVEYLLEKGADIEKEGSSDTFGVFVPPLHLACMTGKVEVVRLLLDKGANIESEDRGKDRPLHVAARYRHAEIVRELLQRGAEVNARNDLGFTPLYSILVNGSRGDLPSSARNDEDCRRQVAIARILIENNAEVDAKDRFGKTTLFWAVETNNFAFVQFLVENGSDINMENARGETLLIKAFKEKSLRKVKKLVALGANINDEYETLCTRDDLSPIQKMIAEFAKEKIQRKKELEKSFLDLKNEQSPSDMSKKQKVISLMNDKEVPVFAKKKMMPELIEFNKNHEDTFSKSDFGRGFVE